LSLGIIYASHSRDSALAVVLDLDAVIPGRDRSIVLLLTDLVIAHLQAEITALTLLGGSTAKNEPEPQSQPDERQQPELSIGRLIHLGWNGVGD
jgi:hypothetical protein